MILGKTLVIVSGFSSGSRMDVEDDVASKLDDRSETVFVAKYVSLTITGDVVPRWTKVKPTRQYLN